MGCGMKDLEAILNGTGSAKVKALTMVMAERERQNTLKKEGRFKYTLNDASIQESEKLACLVEEIGEISRNVLSRSYLVSDGDRTNASLLVELSQVAALSCAWMERLIEDENEEQMELDEFDAAEGQGRR
jgi:hypothetical protein